MCSQRPACWRPVATVALYVTGLLHFTCLHTITQIDIARVYTDDSKHWDNDPLDANHQGKRYILKQARISIVVPNHPDYQRPKRPSLVPQPRAKALASTCAPSLATTNAPFDDKPK
jgi:hypothetical protein